MTGDRMKEEKAVTLANLLEEARQKAGLTQQQLFELYKTSGGRARQPNTLGNWLRGNSEPRVSEYERLAEILNERLGPADQLPTIRILRAAVLKLSA